MSESSPGKLEAAVRIAAAFALALLVIGFVWTISAEHSAERVRASERAHQYASGTADSIKRACTGSQPPALYECIAKEIAATRESQRDEYDLSAQNQMADWAFWMMAVSAVAMALTAWALWYVKGTLDATRDAVKEAVDGTKAALLAAEAGQKSLEHAQKVSAAELRAWVSPRLEAKKVSRIGDQMTFEFDVYFHNYGKTVASGYSQRTWLIFPHDEEPWEDAVRAQWAKWKAPTKVGRAVLMPGEDDVFHGIRGSPMDLLPWGPLWLGRRHLSPIVVVSAFYRTDFDDQWHRTDRAFSIGRRGESTLNQLIDDEEISLGPEDLVAQPASMSLANHRRDREGG